MKLVIGVWSDGRDGLKGWGVGLEIELVDEVVARLGKS